MSSNKNRQTSWMRINSLVMIPGGIYLTLFTPFVSAGVILIGGGIGLLGLRRFIHG